MVVDDLIPCKPSSQGATTPVFSRNKGAELWVVLVEKAYCKLHGAYFATRIGHCYEGLSDLTGRGVTSRAASLHAHRRARHTEHRRQSSS